MKKQTNTLLYVFLLCHVLCFYTHYIQYRCIFLANNKININSCERERLCIVPGIGKRTAQKIYIFRLQKGGLKTFRDLEGIVSKKTLYKVVPYFSFKRRWQKFPIKD